MGDPLRVTDRTRHRRLAERGSHDRDLIHGILDEGLICHVGLTTEAGPVVIPMAYARDGDRLILHGSVGSRLLRRMGEGVDVCVTVTLLDGLVLARSAFHHSMNYRSVMAFGRAIPLREEGERRRALDRLVEHLVPGRTRDARAANDTEMRATAVLALPLDEASAKVRSGPPSDEEQDLELGIWAGVIPLRLTPERPVPAADLAAGIAAPGYVTGYRRGGSGPAATDEEGDR